MIKLLRTELRLLLLNPLSYIPLLSTVITAFCFCDILNKKFFAMTNTHKVSLAKMFFIILLDMLFVGIIAFVISGRDHANRTLKNKILQGYTRGCIYFSKILTALLYGFTLGLFFTVTVFAFTNITVHRDYTPQKLGSLFSILFSESCSDTLFQLLITVFFGIILVFVLVTSLFSAISLTVSSRSVAIVLCIIVFVGSCPLAIQFDKELSQKETIRKLKTENGIVVYPNEYIVYPNPEYVSGIRRTIRNQFIKALPIKQFHVYYSNLAGNLGDSMLIEALKNTPMKANQALLASVILTLQNVIVGYLFFRKKSFK